MRFEIAIQQGTSGPVVYQEQHSDTTNGEGLVVFQIGRGTPVNNSILFSNINWSSGPYYTNISIDTLGNGPFVAMGSFELVSVPFALHAGNGLPSGSSAGQMLQWNGTQWVQISPGQPSQILTFCEGRPVWTTSGFCTGVITSINCGSSVQSGLLYQGRPDTITSTISYVGGNGGQYLAQTIASTGVTGLTAVLSRGNFATGNGALSVTISGTPSSSGNASFALVIGSQSCTLTIPVNAGASISTLSCGTSVNAGNPVSGLPSSGVTSSIPYTGGNGNGYSAVTVASTGVLGLTATLPSGVLANGSGSLTVSITGTPQSSGTASFLLNVGGQTCTLNRTVSSVTIGSLSCGTSTPIGSLISGVAASGVSNVISYTGGGGGTYSAQTITSTGVTGLTATLSAGVLAVGNGSLSYTITGIPNAAGTASFFISIGGQTCTLTRTVASGSVASLICGTTTNGTLINGLSASSVSSVVSYTGGDGGAYVTQMVQSTGVTGLTAVLDSGLFVVGNGTLTYNITGTPSATGTANFAINIGGRTCTLSRTVNAGSIGALFCDSAQNVGVMNSGVAASGVSSTLPYTGGNGGSFASQTFTSTGVTGLTATLTGGNFTLSSGSLTLTITGTPNQSGRANFALNIGGRTCTLIREVNCAVVTTQVVDVLNPITGKIWMDRNLGASRAATFQTDNQAYGDYYQWGRGSDGHQCVNSATTSTLSSISTPGHGDFIVSSSDWLSIQDNTLWATDSSITNPCPTGYRLPTSAEWEEERLSWSSNNSDGAFASPLKLTMAGNRGPNNGVLSDWSSMGRYWSSTIASTNALHLAITSSSTGSGSVPRTNGMSVRCIKNYATVTGITCGTANNGTLGSLLPANNVSSDISYTGGTGGTHNGQVVSSTGVTGLTATLSPGNFVNGNGTLTYSITGTPASAGTANFAISIGSRTCTLSRTVVASNLVSTLTCGTSNNGTLITGVVANGVSSVVSYTGGNGGAYSAQTISSTGVTGLTASLSAGNFAFGNDSLIYTIAGTPSASGTANFAINIGGRTCTLSRTVNAASVGALLCDSAAHTGTLDFNVPASGVSSTLPYTGGNGGGFTTMTFTSTGVTGLTATLTAGNFAVGNGTLTLNISGTPNQSGRANFALNIGGRTCTLTHTVNCTVVSTQVVDVLNPITNKIWMDRDLGASRVATSSTDLQAYGNLYQWGRGSDGHECLSSAATSVMSTLPNPGHGDFITGNNWDWQSPADGSLWTGDFPVTNPCPTGYRPPTPAEWNEERLSWASNTGIGAFASPLKIPMGGFKQSGTVRADVNTRGLYWTSEFGNYMNIPLSSGASLQPGTQRIYGFSVRCIKNYATVTGITCGSNTTGALVAGLVANAVSSDVSYTGGTGGTHNGQVVSSTGVTGLTATLSPGNFANGNGTLTYTITGTPASAGTANFAINIGGRTCTLSRIVANGTVSTLSCGAATHVGTLSQDITASGITSSIPYLGGNGGSYAAQTINSTGVTGLTATVSAGTFAIGSGSISYTINGTPLTHGTANFAITLGGQTCTLSRTVEAAISNLDCNAAIQTGSLGYGLAATGVTSSIPYTNGYGATYAPQVVNSTGVTGLTATLTGGNFAVGNGSLLYTITGTPTNSGTASFAISIGGRTCTLQRSISAPMSSLVCSSAVHVGTLSQGVVASGVSSSIPYTGGNGGTYPIHTFTSTGVTGLTATLSAGTFASGSGSLNFNITGTPNANGTATFAINIGGVTCSLIRQVVCIPTQTAVVDVYNPTTNQIWMDRNLGATRVPINNTDAQGYGDLYQWGRSGDGHQCRSTGTTTALASNDNPGSEFIITPSTGDWRASRNDNLWQGANGTNNPCPAGYRLPTQAEWDAERLSWSSNNAPGAYGSPLRLSLAGYREFSNALLYSAGSQGYYWSSTISGANVLTLLISSGSFPNYQRGYGFTVRCIKVNESLVSLSCSTAQHTGSLGYGVVANGVSSSIPYTGGDGSAYTGLTIPSTGVTGLTATLSPGTFATGNGSVVFTITGTPSTQGVASFAINNLGGQFCTLQRTVAPPMSNLDCDAAVHTGILNGGVLASGVSSSIPYTGGNGGSYPLHTFTSTGVTGLTATLSAGAFASGSGSLNFTITGTPNTNGFATFAINIGGVTCSLIREVVCIPTTTVVNDVINPTTNRTWMDRNLGATRVSINPTDASGHGDLYQWGRSTDGHQCRSSGTTTALASTDTPGPNFIITPTTLNWRASLNNNLWQGTTGTNNPCPTGYRLPTQAEWDAERLSWSSSNSSGAYGSPLRLSMSGWRTPDGAALQHAGSYGFYWSSTVSGLDAVHLRFWSSVTLTGISRGYGFAVRCIKD